MSGKNLIHYLILAGIIALAAALRFWNLDFKALWLDEVITALFSLGHRYDDVPLNVALPLSALPSLFTLKPVSCSDIVQTLATQSTHPPLFFCLMHGWMSWLDPLSQSLAWKLRSLPALLGIINCLAIYGLNRLAFSQTAGLLGAAIMAVSPFGVYLSQEARHYTLPILIITLALIALIQIQRDFDRAAHPKVWVWLFWVMINSIGFYTHYFFILAFIAQIITLLILTSRQRKSNKQIQLNYQIAIILGVVGVIISYLPWLPMLLGHFGRSETSWLPPPNNIAPIYQSLVAWVLTIIALPVENQPIWVQIPAGVIMIVFFAWVTKVSFRGLKELWQKSETYNVTFTLVCFTGLVLLEIWAIAYFLRKDITIVPRYNFVYYPALCSLLGASLSLKYNHKQFWIIFIVGLLSCSFLVNNLAFLKPFYPQKVAQTINNEPNTSQFIIMGYRNNLDIASGLSYSLELSKTSTKSNIFSFIPVNKIGELSLLENSPSPLNLWIIAPGFKQASYPKTLQINRERTCTSEPKKYYRVGEFPYQLYRCF